jgi:hypothetical protein
MLELVNVGLIKHIPKGIERDLVGGRNPITLLKVSYKIIAKALAQRMRLLVAYII